MNKIEKRNITISLPIDLLKQAKVLAAQRETSVNAIMAESLRKEVQGGQAGYMACVEEFLAKAKQIRVKLPKERWTRDSLYDA